MPREPIEERAEISRVVREASLLTHPDSRTRILRHHRAELVPEQIEVGITADRYVCHDAVALLYIGGSVVALQTPGLILSFKNPPGREWRDERKKETEDGFLTVGE